MLYTPSSATGSSGMCIAFGSWLKFIKSLCKSCAFEHFCLSLNEFHICVVATCVNISMPSMTGRCAMCKQYHAIYDWSLCRATLNNPLTECWKLYGDSKLGTPFAFSISHLIFNCLCVSNNNQNILFVLNFWYSTMNSEIAHKWLLG